MKFLKANHFNPGQSAPALVEKMEEIKFNVVKFNTRPKPKDKKRILIITCFSEFGCESIAVHYCIPRILQKYPGVYVIMVGWYGREYLYRHLVDEYWELKEEHQWLREFSRAFNHQSKNLTKLEKQLANYGAVYPGTAMGQIVLGNICKKCNLLWTEEDKTVCSRCNSTEFDRSLFGNVIEAKKDYVPVPKPSQAAIAKVKSYLGVNPVGIFARNRQCYGRNLQPEFYQKLINSLRQKGYDPIWLGEKQSTLACPDPTVFDFTRQPESRDLELTLAMLSQCKFTVQFWTASTRLAAITGVPYILFESPDQIAGAGQEGYRMALTTDWNKKKLVLSHYWNVYENNDQGIALVEQAIDEMNADNWNHIYGLLEEELIVRLQVKGRLLWREQNDN